MSVDSSGRGARTCGFSGLFVQQGEYTEASFFFSLLMVNWVTGPKLFMWGSSSMTSS